MNMTLEWLGGGWLVTVGGQRLILTDEERPALAAILAPPRVWPSEFKEIKAELVEVQ